MSRVKGVLDATQQALAAKAERDLLDAYHHRYSEAKAFLDALSLFTRCQFYREAGFKSLTDYVTYVVPRAIITEWMGWEMVASIWREETRNEVAKLIYTRTVRPENLYPCRSEWNEKTWRQLAMLTMYVRGTRLKRAMEAFRQLREQGFIGDAIFIPLWVPKKVYAEVFKDEHKPAWEQITTHFRGDK